MSKRILIVDDDPHIVEVISFALIKAGMDYKAAKDGLEALKRFAAEPFDLVVLDISMPELDGLEVCREMRKTSEIPILFLSSRDEEIDRILGLEMGGDDYVTKPFSVRELVARIRTILKRAGNHAAPASASGPLSHGRIELDEERHEVRYDGEEIALTATEFSILKGFLARPQRVFERAEVMEQAYDMNIHVSDRTIDSHIRHIRAKFEACGLERVIETVHGVGYRLGSCE